MGKKTSIVDYPAWGESPRDFCYAAKKTILNLGNVKEWCIPAKKSADFVFNMENILTLYTQLYNVN